MDIAGKKTPYNNTTKAVPGPNAVLSEICARQEYDRMDTVSGREASFEDSRPAHNQQKPIQKRPGAI
jgi:hypothetical protein